MIDQTIQTIFKGVLITSIVTCSYLALAEKQYTRASYNIIIERAPFGIEPQIDEETAPQTAMTQEQAAKDLRLSMLIKAHNGQDARAGLVNTTEKKSFIISVGETVKGIKLLKVDIDNENATLERNGVTLLLKLTKGKESVVPAAQLITARPSRSRVRTIPPPEPAQPAEPVRQPTAEEQEAIRENLRNYQMEVIRKGMPPLPIALTPEMDAQLVEEGVLPPNEEM